MSKTQDEYFDNCQKNMNNIDLHWGQIGGQPMDRVLSSLILLGFSGYLDFDPRLALAKEQPTIYGRLFFCIRETGENAWEGFDYYLLLKTSQPSRGFDSRDNERCAC